MSRTQRAGTTSRTVAVALAVLTPGLVACAPPAPGDRAPGSSGPAPTTPAADPTREPSRSRAESGSVPPSTSPSASPSSKTTAAGPRPSSGRPRDARLTIPAIGVREVLVRSYRGRTDDAAGTAIQNTGIAASPHGPQGGTGPGGIGNYQVTGHRNTAGGVFLELPALRRGDRVRVRVGGRDFVYEVRRTRITSFRSPRSLRQQRAAVPGRPGAEPTRAMITLSTCRTQEDHAEGNYWSDAFDNPEHRFDKVGVLVAVRPVRSAGGSSGS